MQNIKQPIFNYIMLYNMANKNKRHKSRNENITQFLFKKKKTCHEQN
jgi:hypothetical protein